MTNAVHETIKSVWNDKTDETDRQDQSHYRGVGRWADDAAWQGIGLASLNRVRFLWRLLGRPEASVAGLTALEWGPGGGANAFGLRDLCESYYGVDISDKNLAECQRVMAGEGRHGYFRPVLLADAPHTVVARIPEKVDLFLSTAVFQHFPSKEYGMDVVRAIRDLCKPSAAGFIQIRFDNGKEQYKGIRSLDEYAARHIYANSYPIDEFWDVVAAAGLQPLAVNAIRTSNNYATFYLKMP